MSYESIREEHEEQGGLADRLREYLDEEADVIRAAADALTDITDEDEVARVDERTRRFIDVRAILESYEIDNVGAFSPEVITQPESLADDETIADY